MDAFENRERAYENKFAHDLEKDFKIKARRNYLFGLWVAKQLNVKESELESYAESFRDELVDVSELGAAFREAVKRFEEKNAEVNEEEILSTIDKFQLQAIEEKK